MIRALVAGDYAGFFIVFVVLLIAIALHEFGHALAADLQGDPTPRLAGRLTLNPKAHLDPVGTFLLVLVGFGWGKPVSFSLPKLRLKRAGAAIVALAGPAMNIALAIVGAILLARVHEGFTGRFANSLLRLNVLLAVFNLIPIPPLDGSRIIGIFMDNATYARWVRLDQFGMLIVFGSFFLFREEFTTLLGSALRHVTSFMDLVVMA